ncbi:MAG TPA: hypothetical protein VLW49_01165 [Gaiellaceae bacterium]|nr:hypothetical protein [Gaiellaceae bacterium]
MSASTPEARTAPSQSDLLEDIRAYFVSDARRTIQTVLGLIWLLDGALQLQSFMYSNGFPQMLAGMGSAMGPTQPHWLAASVDWGSRLANGDLGLWNTLFALTQLAIGVGLLYRPTVKLALAGSFGWAFVVWWFGEAFGMLFMNTANPLTGAPGAVFLYALIGLLVWPNDRPGGLLGERGARIAWAVLWVVMGWLWLLAPNSSANATHDAIAGAPSGMHWLDVVLRHTADAAKGNGLLIAIVMAAVSVAIGVAVGIDWHARTFLWLAIYVSAVFWVLQGFGGIATGSATDPNAGLLFIVLAAALYTLIPHRETAVRRA